MQLGLSEASKLQLFWSKSKGKAKAKASDRRKPSKREGEETETEERKEKAEDKARKLWTELRNFHRGRSKRKQTSQPFAPKKWKNDVPV